MRCFSGTNIRKDEEGILCLAQPAHHFIFVDTPTCTHTQSVHTRDCSSPPDARQLFRARSLCKHQCLVYLVITCWRVWHRNAPHKCTMKMSTVFSHLHLLTCCGFKMFLGRVLVRYQSWWGAWRWLMNTGIECILSTIFREFVNRLVRNWGGRRESIARFCLVLSLQHLLANAKVALVRRCRRHASNCHRLLGAPSNALSIGSKQVFW